MNKSYIVSFPPFKENNGFLPDRKDFFDQIKEKTKESFDIEPLIDLDEEIFDGAPKERVRELREYDGGALYRLATFTPKKDIKIGDLQTYLLTIIKQVVPAYLDQTGESNEEFIKVFENNQVSLANDNRQTRDQ